MDKCMGWDGREEERSEGERGGEEKGRGRDGWMGHLVQYFEVL